MYECTAMKRRKQKLKLIVENVADLTNVYHPISIRKLFHYAKISLNYRPR